MSLLSARSFSRRVRLAQKDKGPLFGSAKLEPFARIQAEKQSEEFSRVQLVFQVAFHVARANRRFGVCENATGSQAARDAARPG